MAFGMRWHEASTLMMRTPSHSSCAGSGECVGDGASNAARAADDESHLTRTSHAELLVVEQRHTLDLVVRRLERQRQRSTEEEARRRRQGGEH